MARDANTVDVAARFCCVVERRLTGGVTEERYQGANLRDSKHQEQKGSTQWCNGIEIKKRKHWKYIEMLKNCGNITRVQFCNWLVVVIKKMDRLIGCLKAFIRAISGFFGIRKTLETTGMDEFSAPTPSQELLTQAEDLGKWIHEHTNNRCFPGSYKIRVSLTQVYQPQN